MSEAFRVADLIEVFRSGLIALIPIAERARIAWRGPDVYDPWENIEEALFSSIVGSVVDNAVPIPLRPVPKYGTSYGCYADLSFVTERKARLRGERLVFVRLTTAREAFDSMRFRVVDADFVPTGQTVELPVPQALPELAARSADGIRYCDAIECDE